MTFFLMIIVDSIINYAIFAKTTGTKKIIVNRQYTILKVFNFILNKTFNFLNKPKGKSFQEK